ncbi:MAG: outer membrane protein assembly factor BamB [Woeseiaceae bacterium]
MKIARQRITVLLGAFALASCGLFGGDEEELKPAELIDFTATVKVKRVWKADLGSDAEFLRVALQPASDGNRIFAASHDGNVSAYDPVTGKLEWRTKLDLELSAGPGVGEGLVVVTAKDGMIIALDANSGDIRWQVDVDGESLARPLVADDHVIVQTVDNRLRALQSFDGEEAWAILQAVPALTMRGTAPPVRVGSAVVAGFDNGRLVSVNIETGSTNWEALLAPPTGRSDLERLADIDGAMAVISQDIYAAGYQGRLASVAAESGQIIWASDISTYEGVSADWRSLYTVEDQGVIIALTRRNGTESWRQEALLRREPTLPVPYRSTVAVGDLEGYLHFFSNLSGEPVARVRVDNKAISNDPVVFADRLYVQSDAGTITAYEIEESATRDRSRDIAGDEGA